jgi:hypothetical protein
MPEWKVIRIVRETFYVQDASTAQEAKDMAVDPSSVVTLKETATLLRRE